MVDKPWSITSQRQTQRVRADGRLGDFMEIVWLSRPSNTVSMELIPIDQYTVENVARILDERHALIEAVHEL